MIDEVLLRKFCYPHGSGYCRDPWNEGGWRYATDGRIAIRCLTDAPDDLGRHPAVARLFDQADESVIVGEWPNCKDLGQTPTGKQCSYCEGSGLGSVPCDCLGTGRCTCEACGGEHRCQRCNGRGRMKHPDREPCRRCNGTGSELAPVAVVLCGADYLVRADDYSRIASLPELTAPVLCPGPLIRFHFRGGQGIVAVEHDAGASGESPSNPSDPSDP